MSVAKFASLTADLLARKGEALPSVIAPLRIQRQASSPMLVLHDSSRATPLGDDFFAVNDAVQATKPARGTVTLPADESETIALIAIKKGTPRQEILRLARETGGEIIVPVDVSFEGGGCVLLKLFGAPELFRYHRVDGCWRGTEGSSFEGSENAFNDGTGWSIVITLTEPGTPLVEICHHGDCTTLQLAR